MLYRVDKFVVPEQVRDEFWTHVKRTHAVLREQPGFVDDALLEQDSGPGRFNAVTIVRWASPDDLAAAREAVEKSHREADFHPADFFATHGIEPDLANYAELASGA